MVVVGPSTVSTLVNGLANGTQYTFDVVATNGGGNGPPGLSNAITTPDLPSAPTTFAVALDFGVATLTWSAPASDGGSPVTGFTVTATTGASTLTQPVSSTTYKAVFEGLVDGASYTFAVTATNAVGTGPAASLTESTPCGGLGLPGYPALSKSDSATYCVGLFVGDYDGDGNPDVLVPSGALQVYRGEGNGRFARGLETVTGFLPAASASADVNGDGKLDWIGVTNSGNVNVFLGDGTGKFGAPIANGTVTGAITGIAVGDLNGDGKLDLVIIANSVNANFSVLLGAGNGNFPQRVDTVVTGVVSANALALADLDQDGKLDLVLGGAVPSNGAVVFMKGAGDGTFGTPKLTTGVAAYLSTPAASADIKVADMDGDGHLDVVAAGDTMSVSIFWGNGTGALAAPTTVAVGSYVHALAIGDFNGDGKPDIVAGSNDATTGNVPPPTGLLYVILANGTRTFAADANYPTPALGDHDVAAADVDGDGKLDIVAGSTNIHGVLVFHGKGDGTFVAPATYSEALDTSDVAAARLDGPASPWSAITLGFTPQAGGGRAANQLWVRTANPDGSLQAPVVSNFYDPTSPSSIGYWTQLELGDVNGDGKPDAIALEQQIGGIAAFDVLLNQGGGLFAFSKRYTIAGGAYLVLADVNHDGKLDVVVHATTGVAIFPGNGNGTFGIAYTALQNLISDSAGLLAVGDFNGDGNPDLYAVNQAYVALGNGDFTFQTPKASNGAGATVFPLVLDVNGDGKLDVVLSQATTLVAYLGDGTGAFTPSTTTVVAGANGGVYTRRGLAAADIDGDGHVDLFFTSWGMIGVALGAGDGTFPRQLGYTAGGSYLMNVATGDLNGDGRPDAVGNTGFGEGFATSIQPNTLTAFLNTPLNACY
jgi:hypothetical protein